MMIKGSHIVSVLIILCLIGLMGELRAQSSLEFSRVLKVSTVEDTVPSGYTWKVATYLQSQTQVNENSQSTSCSVSSYHHPLIIDGELYYFFEGGVGTGRTDFWRNVGNKLPVWLPAGSTVKTVCTGDFASIIEFKITP